MNIVFEGIDGVGKTTLIRETIEDLKRKKEIVRFIDELTENSPISDVLNNMLKDNPFFHYSKDYPTSIFESLLLAADMHYRQEKYKYNDGYNIYDRDFLSILSYQKELLKNDYENYMEFYDSFKKIVLFNLKPIDLVVYMYGPIETTVERVRKRDGKILTEKQISFLSNLKSVYENELLPEVEDKNVKVLRLDGRNNPRSNLSAIYREINYGKN